MRLTSTRSWARTFSRRAQSIATLLHTASTSLCAIVRSVSARHVHSAVGRLQPLWFSDRLAIRLLRHGGSVEASDLCSFPKVDAARFAALANRPCEARPKTSGWISEADSTSGNRAKAGIHEHAPLSKSEVWFSCLYSRSPPGQHAGVFHSVSELTDRTSTGADATEGFVASTLYQRRHAPLIPRLDDAITSAAGLRIMPYSRD